MSQSVVGAIRVNLGLDAAQFANGANRARTVSQQLQRDFMRIAAGAAAVGAALGAMTRQTMQSASQIHRFAQIANATPESFQRWTAGARTVGIEQEKLADILKDVNDRVGDFVSTGGGPMADFFENIAPRVGVTADQFARLSGPEALQLYITSLERAGLNQQEMTFYLEAMASDATALIPLLRNGGAEMERLGDRAEQLGAVMDARTIASFQAAQVALMGVSEVFTGFRNQVSAQIIPTVTVLANAFTESAMAGGIVNSVIQGIVGQIPRLTAYITAAVGSFAAYRLILIGVAAAKWLVVGATNGLRTALLRLGLPALIIGAGEVIHQFGRLATATGGIGNAFTLLGEVGREVWRGIVRSAGGIPLGLRGVWAGVEEGFHNLVASLSTIWAGFLRNMVGSLGGIETPFGSIDFAEMLGLDEAIGARADEFARVQGQAASMAGWRSETFLRLGGERMGQGFDVAREALGRLGEAVIVVTEEAAVSAGEVGAAFSDAAGANGGGGGANALRQAIDNIRESTRALRTEAAEYNAIADGGARIANAMEYAQTRVQLLNAAMQAGVPITDALRASVHTLALEYSEAAQAAQQARERLEEMEASGQRGADAITNIFMALGKGSDAAKQAIAQLLAEMARVMMMRAVMGLGQTGGGGFLNFLGGLLSFDGGGFTGSRARTGGLDGKGGFPAILHPNETVIDHTKGVAASGGGQGGGGGVSRLELFLSPELEARILQKAGGMSLQIMRGGLAQNRRTLPGQIDALNARGTIG